ncbi:plasmid replication protein [Clostridium perfringens]|uniref:plasmid replication protein n=1 Tax=Clostridium perfringens TaxID=1502 RepID=UPI002246AC28|nr:plasmid replication protein [Clostridium perfringens]MCX0353446.1 plasmid replication protein [Clostridium perfringens]
MKNYKTKFTEKEINLLNTVERINTRNSIMSLYAYLICQTKDNGTLSFSYRSFLNKYNRSHKKISLGTLKNRIDTLVTLGLLTVKKVKQSCEYILNRFLNSSKVDISIENTNLECNDSEHKYINNNIFIDLYSNSEKEFDSSKYEKCTSLVDVRNKVRELLKIKKVKSSWIIERVFVKVTQNYRKITVRFLESYILKTIASQRELYYKNYNKYIKSKITPNFTQREDYNYIILEQQLLAHY